MPQPSDQPEPLRDLNKRIIDALSPLKLDTGKHDRAEHGYRIHTCMVRFAWKPVTVKEAIKELPTSEDRKKARAARRFLLASAESAYKFYHDKHRNFLLAEWDGDDAAALKLPLRFIESVGVECAVWPHLYWSVAMCETKVRDADSRAAKEQGLVDDSNSDDDERPRRAKMNESLSSDSDDDGKDEGAGRAQDFKEAKHQSKLSR